MPTKLKNKLLRRGIVKLVPILKSFNKNKSFDHSLKKEILYTLGLHGEKHSTSAMLLRTSSLLCVMSVTSPISHFLVLKHTKMVDCCNEVWPHCWSGIIPVFFFCLLFD